MDSCVGRSVSHQDLLLSQKTYKERRGGRYRVFQYGNGLVSITLTKTVETARRACRLNRARPRRNHPQCFIPESRTSHIWCVGYRIARKWPYRRGVRRARAPVRQVRVVNNGVELDRFPPFEMRAGARASHPFRSDLPKDAILLTSVGRQVKRKGFAWFIEHVMPRLPEHVHYWLGGDGPEGDAIHQR